MLSKKIALLLALLLGPGSLFADDLSLSFHGFLVDVESELPMEGPLACRLSLYDGEDSQEALISQTQELIFRTSFRRTSFWDSSVVKTPR